MAGDAVRRLTTPLSYETLASLHAGDRVRLSGVILTGRDAAHKRLVDLLDEGKPFHAHEVFEDAWKSGPEAERELWRGLAQLAVGVTHAARGNRTGAAALLRRGADSIAPFADRRPHGIDIPTLCDWASALADSVQRHDTPPDPAAIAPRVRP